MPRQYGGHYILSSLEIFKPVLEIFMYLNLIKDKLFEQSEVYNRVKRGDISSVQYKKFYDAKWGTSDENYTNRNRLAHYLLYAHIDDEQMILFLFEEELKDRQTNSFQGIGDSLNILTTLLQRYNISGKYNKLFEAAKNANFDCACGYDAGFLTYDDIDSLDIMDCIYLAQELDYKDTMDLLVMEWKVGITEWTDSVRTDLIRFNSFLGKDQENELQYRELLKNALKKGKTFDIVSAYNNIIELNIKEKQFEIAYSYLKEMIETVDFTDILEIRLFSSVLEESFEIICGFPQVSQELWTWSKPYLTNKRNMFGNLYEKAIAAAKCCKDSYAEQLEQDYIAWKNEIGLK